MSDFLSFLRTAYDELGNFNVEFRIRSEDDWPVTLDYWFGADTWRQSGHSFELIGVDSTGGLYCLWTHPDLAGREPPVVFMGSEGEGVGVIAETMADLVDVLAQGYAWVGHEGSYQRDEEWLEPDVLARFSGQARQTLNRDARSPEEILVAARDQHPDFKAWVDQQVG